MLSQTPGFAFRASEDGGAEVSAVVTAGGGGDEADGSKEIAAVLVAGGATEVSAVVVAGVGDEAGGEMEVSAVAGVGGEAGGGRKVSAVVVVGGADDEAGGRADFPAVLVADSGGKDAAPVVLGFAFVRAAGGFMAASSTMTGSGVTVLVGAMPESPDCMELDSFTAIRTGTLCG